MSWLREFFRPALKCVRLGHCSPKKPTERHFYRYPGRGFRSVADDVTEERDECSRCGEGLTGWVETHYSGLQGLSMSSDRWNRLKRDGRLDY